MEIYRVNKIWQLADVYDIRRKTKIDGVQVPRQSEFDEEYDKIYNYILIHENDIPVGTTRLNLANKEFGKIERVSVIEKFQSKGYGKKLIESAEAWVKDMGLSKIVITSLPSAEGFYEKQGYKKTRIYKGSDRDLIYMEKII